MRRFDPLLSGRAKVIGGLTLTTLVLAKFSPFESPNPGLMYAIAQVGIAVVFAFIVEAVWMIERANRDDDDHRDWLGVTCGLGVAGLLGVIAALAVGGYRAAGHVNFLDSWGFWWSALALSTLGGAVVVRPLLADLDRESEKTTEPHEPA